MKLPKACAYLVILLATANAQAAPDRPQSGGITSQRNTVQRPCSQALTGSFLSPQAGGGSYIYQLRVQNRTASTLSFMIGVNGFPPSVSTANRFYSVPASGTALLELGRGSNASINPSTVLVTYDGGGSGSRVVNINTCRG